MAGRRSGVVLTREEAAERRLNPEQRQRAIGHIEAANMLRLSRSGDIEGVAIVDADVLIGGVLLAIDEVDRRRHIEFLAY